MPFGAAEMMFYHPYFLKHLSFFSIPNKSSSGGIMKKASVCTNVDKRICFSLYHKVNICTVGIITGNLAIDY